MAQQPTISKMETTQTAVEWFAEQVEKILIDLKRNNNPFQLELCLHGINELEEQAKQMEREQHESTCVEVIERILDKLEKGENTNSQDVFNQYYNETYKQQ